MITAQSRKELSYEELEKLRKKLNDKEYLAEAIQRIALILSNEIMNIPQRGGTDERQRQGRK
ncbi:MAG: hypothetical protein LBQ88_18820 [Treponema sp.]|jgi:hypothetical protein|nr:hypothetical protein [Treponema sp.]